MTSTTDTQEAATFEPVLRGNHRLHLEVHDRHGQLIGHVVPLTPATLDDETVAQLTRWRNLAKHAFLTQFEATPERTRRWLETTVFPDSARLMFLIHSLDRRVGQVGLRDLTDDTVQLDNTLRGERGGAPDLMLMAHVSVMEWAFAQFSLRSIYCHVFEDNAPILRLLDALGLQVVARIPLELESDAETRAFRQGKAGEASSIGRYYLRLEVAAEAFGRRWREQGRGI